MAKKITAPRRFGEYNLSYSTARDGYAVFTPERQRDFLNLLAEGQSPSKAASAVGITRRVATYVRNSDPEFAAAWEDAQGQATDLLEDTLWDLATKSKWGPAAMFLLKARRPSVYAVKLVNASVTIDHDREVYTHIESIEQASISTTESPFTTEEVEPKSV